MVVLSERQRPHGLQRALPPVLQSLQAEPPGRRAPVPEVPLQAGRKRGDAGLKQTEKPIPFAKLPKPLIAVPISNDAKLLYTLLSDRFQLSQKNGIADEDGFTCCFYPNREIQASMQCAHGKATNLLRELESAGLIYRRRTGKGKPDRIYVGGIQDDDGEESEYKICVLKSAENLPMSWDNAANEASFSA